MQEKSAKAGNIPCPFTLIHEFYATTPKQGWKTEKRTKRSPHFDTVPQTIAVLNISLTSYIIFQRSMMLGLIGKLLSYIFWVIPNSLSIEKPASTLPRYEVLSAKETEELNHNWSHFKVASRPAYFDTVPETIAVHNKQLFEYHIKKHDMRVNRQVIKLERFWDIWKHFVFLPGLIQSSSINKNHSRGKPRQAVHQSGTILVGKPNGA